MRVKEESEKSSLELNIQKTKIMASGPSIHGKQMGKCGSDRFYFLGLQNAAGSDCCHEIKRRSLEDKL